MKLSLKSLKFSISSKRQFLFFALASVMVVLVALFIFQDLSFLIGKFNIVLKEEAVPITPAAFDINGFQALHLIK